MNKIKKFMLRLTLLILFASLIFCNALATTKFSSAASRIKSEVKQFSDCKNGKLVADDVKKFLCELEEDLCNLDEYLREVGRPFWTFSHQPVGPDAKGLLVNLYTESAVGNEHYLLYRKDGRKLVLLGKFEGCEFKILQDRVNNGLYDIYTMWHMSAAGGPYKYYSWTGSEYKIYKSGDLEEETLEKEWNK